MTDDITTSMNKSKGKILLLRLRNNKTIKGRLKDYDIHMNLSLANAEDVSVQPPVTLGKILLRGDNILAISLPEDLK